MSEPTPVTSSEAYVPRLLDRLRLLQECYGSAMHDLGITWTPSSGPTSLGGDIRAGRESTVAGRLPDPQPGA